MRSAQRNALRENNFRIPERLVVKLVECVLFARQAPFFLVAAVATHLVADAAVLFQLFAVVEQKLVARCADRFGVQLTDVLSAKVQKERVAPHLGADRLHGIDRQRLYGGGEKPVIRIFIYAGIFPAGVVVLRLFKADFFCRRIVTFRKSRVVAEGAAGRISRVIGAFPAFIAGKKELAVEIRLAEERLPPVARYPHSVDKPLVVGVDGNHVVAGVQKGGDVLLHIIIGTRIGGRGTLHNGFSVDIKFEIIVRRDPDAGVCEVREGKAFPEQNMAVLIPLLCRGHGLFLPFLVKYVDGSLIGKIPVTDEFS